MQDPPPASDMRTGEYVIDARAVPNALCRGYVALVVVNQLPDMHELFREEFLDCGRPWAQLRDARAAAIARGQQLARAHLCSQSATSTRPSTAGDGVASIRPLSSHAQQQVADHDTW